MFVRPSCGYVFFFYGLYVVRSCRPSEVVTANKLEWNEQWESMGVRATCFKYELLGCHGLPKNCLANRKPTVPFASDCKAMKAMMSP